MNAIAVLVIVQDDFLVASLSDTNNWKRAKSDLILKNLGRCRPEHLLDIADSSSLARANVLLFLLARFSSESASIRSISRNRRDGNLAKIRRFATRTSNAGGLAPEGFRHNSVSTTI